MNLDEHGVTCPYCGEAITAFIDSSQGSLEYVEDCTVCCRPIVMRVEVVGDTVTSVFAMNENDA